MRNITAMLLILLAFFLGTIASNFNFETEKPFSFFTAEVISPNDWIKERQIKIYKDKVVIEIENATLARYANTNSMDPILDENSNGIEIIPSSPEQIFPGDIVTYEKEDMLIVHRVLEKGKDEKGFYFILKGDNNGEKEKIRFEQIKYVTIAIVY